MVFNFGDVSVAAKNTSKKFSNIFINNPLNTSVVLAILICMLIIYIFRDENISNPRKKFFNLFFYSLFLFTTVIFLHDEIIYTRTKDKLSGPDIVLGGSLNNASNIPVVPGGFSGGVIMTPPFLPTMSTTPQSGGFPVMSS